VPPDSLGWHVRDTQFRERVPAADMRTFMTVCPDKPFPRGTVIFHAGDPATHLHVVASGQVKLVIPTPDGRERILAVCGPEDFFGEAFIDGDDVYRVDAVALTDAVTCPMNHEDYRKLSLHAPGFVLAFTQILAGKLFACRDQLARVEAPIRARVAELLLEQAERFGQQQGEGWWSLETELRHDDLAGMVPATRVSVTSAIASLRSAGVLEGTRGRYRLHREGLAVAASGLDG
jgi:CRP/FNR family transcriptional regulator, cyclic AMP receptor protein